MSDSKKILLTGAFGNIGFSTLQELLKQGHNVRSFDLKNRQTQKKARQVAGKTEIVWGDIRDARQVAGIVVDQDVIIHIAAILPPDIDKHPEEAFAVNVEGTRSLLEAARQQQQPPKFLFSSSLDVFGYTQDQPPPRKVTDPVAATDTYTTHKLQDEEMIKTSGLTWSIYRFADVPPLTPRKPHPIMFHIPLNTRFDMLHTTDAGLAIANGLAHDEIWGRVWLIGGGPRCQIYYRDYLDGMMAAMCVGKLPEEAFGYDPYCTDWLDSEESEQLLHYQRHSFDEIIAELAQYMVPGSLTKLLIPVVRPFVRHWLLRMSPYLKTSSKSVVK
jgi:nucleoside-diphosphate-sugar epimerase